MLFLLSIVRTFLLFDLFWFFFLYASCMAYTISYRVIKFKELIVTFFPNLYDAHASWSMHVVFSRLSQSNISCTLMCFLSLLFDSLSSDARPGLYNFLARVIIHRDFLSKPMLKNYNSWCMCACCDLFSLAGKAITYSSVYTHHALHGYIPYSLLFDSLSSDALDGLFIRWLFKNYINRLVT